MKLIKVTKAFLYMSLCFLAKVLVPFYEGEKYKVTKERKDSIAVDSIKLKKYFPR